jgi:hypothetical protein
MINYLANSGERGDPFPPRGPVMNSYTPYRKLATLKNGEKVLIRFLNGEDRESLPPAHLPASLRSTTLT